MRARPLAILALIGLGLLGLYFWIASADSSIDPGPVDSPLAGVKKSEDEPAAEKLEAAARTEIRDAVGAGKGVAPDPDPEHGALLVRVVWSDDTPAENIAVLLRRSQRGYPYNTLKREISDAKGVVRFDGLEPGTYAARSHRGGYDKPAEATVVAGKTAEARLELPVGVEVHGIVVDGKGAAVSDAGIWLTSGSKDWLGGCVVTRSDAKGKFRVRGAKKDASIGALVAGFAPSALVDLDDFDTAKPPVSIRLTVKAPGGGIEGTITSPAGDPVAGAVVCVGKQPRRFKQRSGGMWSHVETWTPLVATTNAEGHYAVRGVTPGEHPLVVRADAAARFHAKVVIEASATLRKDIQLLGGFTVRGAVRDRAGKPITGAIVRAFDHAFDESFIQSGQIDYESVFGYQYTVSGTDGIYRLPHLTPGPVHLYAMRSERPPRGKAKPRAKTIVEGEDGAVVVWLAVIERGNTIEGIVTFRDGVPMKNHFVAAHNDETGLRQSVTTNKEGRFEFVNMELANHSLGVQYWNAPKGTPPLEKKKVWPNRGEVRLVAVFDAPEKKPLGKVRGRIHDTAGRVRTGALSVILQSDQNFWHTAREPKDGKFEFDRVKPGKFKVVAKSGETVILAGPWFEVAAAEVRDVGTLVTEPGGAVEITFHREKGTEKIEPTLWLSSKDTNQSVPVRPGTAGSHRVENLCPGEYTVSSYATGMMSIRGDAAVTVEAGAVAKLSLRLRAAALCPVEVTLPEDRPLGAVTLSIVDSNGKTSWKVTERNTGAIPNPYKRKASLAPGRYVLSVKSTTGLKGEQEFEVKNTDPEQPVVRLTVR